LQLDIKPVAFGVFYVFVERQCAVIGIQSFIKLPELRVNSAAVCENFGEVRLQRQRRFISR
jgi:hypothetical protein